MSLNCRGLAGMEKRRDVLNYIKQKNCSIYFLQDTHFTADDYVQIRSFWGHDVYISPSASNARGTAILFNNNFEYKVLNVLKDNDCNLLAIEVEIVDKYTFLLANIYGPNTDSPDFFVSLSELVDNFDGDFVIMAGDFNLVQDTTLDYYNYVNTNNKKARDVVLNMKEVHGLVDPWRLKYQQRKRFTWFKAKPVKKARLDYFLISSELMSLVDKADISPGYRSDHSMIELDISLSKFEKGKGFWKFNNSLLHDKTYVDLIKDTLSKIKAQYIAPPFNPSMVTSIQDEQLLFTINDQSFFEQLLLCIRGITISYCSNKKRIRNENTKLLEEEIKRLEELRNFDHSEEILEKLSIAQTKLEEFRKDYIKGLFVRTKLKWIEHGEKPTKYFLSLEKRNYVNKTVNKLVQSNGDTITDQSDILSEIENFYKNLYSSCDNKLHDVDISTIVDKTKVNLLDNDMSCKLEGIITREEALAALKGMKNDKSPGTDGFSAEFFKFFWKDIGHFLIRSLNFGFSKGELSITQKQGIISILPKGTKPREYLSNWRPISLLNVTYKIASACIANRIKTVLNFLIHDNQKGFLKDRFIGENTRLIYDALHITKEEQIPGMILLIDFEKAFDSISWRFMYDTLNF